MHEAAAAGQGRAPPSGARVVGGAVAAKAPVDGRDDVARGDDHAVVAQVGGHARPAVLRRSAAVRQRRQNSSASVQQQGSEGTHDPPFYAGVHASRSTTAEQQHMSTAVQKQGS